MDSINEQQFSDWARRMCNSDESAFKELFDATFENYVRYAWRFTKNKDSAMDIVQEGFIKLWNYRDKLDPSQSLKTYIYRMIKHKALNHLRDRRHDDVPLADLELVADSGPEFEEQAETESALGSSMKKWIEDLPDRQQEAFKLSRFEGLTHEEIAEVMEVSPRTVNNHIVAALNTLQEQYQRYKDGKKNNTL